MDHACRKATAVPIVNVMDIPPELIQLAGSLVAILALAGIARWLKLGKPVPISSLDEARLAAKEAVHGFDAIELAVDRDGRGAILRDTAGRILLLKQHGNKFAGRILGGHARAAAKGNLLNIESGEKRFGVIAILVDGAPKWADAINQLNGKMNA